MISPWWNTTMNVSCLWSVNHSNVLKWYRQEKKLNKSKCWNKQLEINYPNDRTQPQISGAFLFLTKYRNSIYFLNTSIAFSEIYYAVHICTTKVKKEEMSSSILFPWSPELSFSRKTLSPVVFMKLSIAKSTMFMTTSIEVPPNLSVLCALHRLFLEESEDPLPHSAPGIGTFVHFGPKQSLRKMCTLLSFRLFFC